jgi:ADP-ribose pyrophosphatase YjhB (NUDIX family)
MEIPSVQATVVLLMRKDDSVCLARKKKAIHHEGGEISYSLGLYNGYGGKREVTDMTIEDTALRELYDESGVVVKKEDLEPVLRVYFYIKKEEGLVPFMDVSFFLVLEWEGEPQEGSEMGDPVFFTQDTMPYEEMMPADRVLFEKIFAKELGFYQVTLLGKDIRPEVTQIAKMYLV